MAQGSTIVRVNAIKVNGTAFLTGNGTTGTGSLRVTIASDNTAFAVNATLSAETTKVIGTINVAAAQTIAVTNAGTFAVTQGTAANLNATVVGTGTFLVQAAQSGTWNVGTVTTVTTVSTITNVVHIDDNSGSITVDNGGTFAVQATLAAETTKVIGTVRTGDGSGNLYTSNSTTYTAKFGQDSNLLGTLGTAFSTAGKIDIKAADGDVFVRQATGSNLHMVVDSGTITTVSTVTAVTTVSTVTNLAQMNGAVLLMGNGATGTGSQRSTIANDNTGIANWGHGATGASVPAGATYSGSRGTTALPAAVSDGQQAGTLADKFGRTVAVLGTVRDLRATQTTTVTASTSETTIVTAGAAGIFNDIISIVVSNTSASTNTRIDFRDATAGTVIFSLQVPANQTTGFTLPGTSIPQTTSANNWTATCGTSTTDIRILVIYEKNK